MSVKQNVVNSLVACKPRHWQRWLAMLRSLRLPGPWRVLSRVTATRLGSQWDQKVRRIIASIAEPWFAAMAWLRDCSFNPQKTKRRKLQFDCKLQQATLGAKNAPQLPLLNYKYTCRHTTHMGVSTSWGPYSRVLI